MSLVGLLAHGFDSSIIPLTANWDLIKKAPTALELEAESAAKNNEQSLYSALCTGLKKKVQSNLSSSKLKTVYFCSQTHKWRTFNISSNGLDFKNNSLIFL